MILRALILTTQIKKHRIYSYGIDLPLEVTYNIRIDNHAVVSSFFSPASFCFLAYYFLMSFSLWRHFWAIEKVLVDNFLTLKLKSVKDSLFSCFLLLSKIISDSYLALSLPSASIASRTGIKVCSKFWTYTKLTVYLARLASWVCRWASLVGSPFSL
jgi:hypothetical protein